MKRSKNPGSSLPIADRRVVWKRHARNYARLREQLDTYYLKHSSRAGGDWELPHTVRGWRQVHSDQVRRAYPELEAQVLQIEALAHEREQVRQGVMPKSPIVFKPLPTDPIEREVERKRRAVESMRKLREKRRGVKNGDLVGL